MLVLTVLFFKLGSVSTISVCVPILHPQYFCFLSVLVFCKVDLAQEFDFLQQRGESWETVHIGFLKKKTKPKPKNNSKSRVCCQDRVNGENLVLLQVLLYWPDFTKVLI